jgi:hypothetical protein
MIWRSSGRQAAEISPVATTHGQPVLQSRRMPMVKNAETNHVNSKDFALSVNQDSTVALHPTTTVWPRT